MRRMADHTALTHGLMLVNKRAALLGVTLKASFVSAQERKTACLERLLDIRAAAFDCDSLVRVVTIGTTHFTFWHRMMMRQLELCAHLKVTLETSIRRLPRIDDRTSAATGFDMQAPGAVARFAAHVDGLLYSYAVLCLTAFSAARGCVYRFLFPCLQPRVRGGFEIAHELMMACIACIGANKFRAGNTWRGDNGSI